MLYQAAASGQIHDPVADWHNHTLQTHRWYTVGNNGFQEEMPLLLDKNRHWVAGPIGHETKKAVLCDYYDKNTMKFVDLQQFYTIPSTSNFGNR
jgi:hypothetical protein